MRNNNMSSDKYSIAWFKLAECVARGEKERALGVYRLLAHSLEDQAFAAQLVGDLLLAFDDAQAIAEYEHAAQLYQKENRLLEAAAIYEHLITLAPQKELYREKNIELFTHLGHTKQLIRALILFCDLMLENSNYEKAHYAIKHLETIADNETLLSVNQKMFFTNIHNSLVPQDITIYHMSKILDLLINKDNKQMHAFLSRVQDLDESYFVQAQHYLKNQ